MTKENDELQPLGDMNMVTLMEYVDSDSGSQLQGVDVDDPSHEKEGTMANLHGETRNTRGSAYRIRRRWLLSACADNARSLRIMGLTKRCAYTGVRPRP